MLQCPHGISRKAACVNRAIQVNQRLPEDMTVVDVCQAVGPLAALSLALPS